MFSSCKATKSRIANQQLLLSSIKKQSNETLLEYVLQTTQNSLLIDTHYPVIQNLAKTQFLQQIDDKIIRNSLILRRNQ